MLPRWDRLHAVCGTFTSVPFDTGPPELAAIRTRFWCQNLAKEQTSIEMAGQESTAYANLTKERNRETGRALPG